MIIKGKTLQEHLWNSQDEIAEDPYSVWDWVILFEYFKIPINDKDYKSWLDDKDVMSRLQTLREQ